MAPEIYTIDNTCLSYGTKSDLFCLGISVTSWWWEWILSRENWGSVRPQLSNWMEFHWNEEEMGFWGSGDGGWFTMREISSQMGCSKITILFFFRWWQGEDWRGHIYPLRQGLLVDSNPMIHITTNAFSLFEGRWSEYLRFQSHIIRCHI